MNDIFSIPNKERTKYILVYGLIATLAFTVIYGLCNEAASHATYLYSAFFDWELQIPLIPWMIYPYLSLNILFIFSAFVVTDVSAIKGYLLGLTYAAIIAGIIFYIFPAKLGFTREVAVGYEKIFETMFSIDKPHNLFPSLHVTYSSIAIWTMIEQTKNRIFHLFLWGWLVLISCSIILVHQHHLFDILSGFILAYITYEFLIKKIHPSSFNPFYSLGETLLPSKYLHR